MPAGRPSKYDPQYCELALNKLRDGFSVLGVAAEIGVNKTTIYEWMNAHPEFSHAVKVGQQHAAAWWEERLRQIALGENGNATAAIFGLKNRASDEWRDKTETEHSGGVDVRTITRTVVDPKA